MKLTIEQKARCWDEMKEAAEKQMASCNIFQRQKKIIAELLLKMMRKYEAIIIRYYEAVEAAEALEAPEAKE